jgi:hypothetical protein
MLSDGGKMPDMQFVLTIDQRDQIMRAVKAIERQVHTLADKSRWQAVYVVGTNLAIIHEQLTNLPRVG